MEMIFCAHFNWTSSNVAPFIGKSL
jgi:hypothetical protein